MRNTISSLILIISLILFFFNNSFAQAGGSAVPFLLIAPDARFAGMGESGTAIANDINAIYWNPAGLGFLNDMKQSGKKGLSYKEGSIFFSNLLPRFNSDAYLLNFNYGMFISQLDGTIAINTAYMNLGEFMKTDPNGRVLGKYTSNEFAIGLAYGTKLTEELALGFQLKYIQSNLEPATSVQQGAGTGISAAFDLGLLWNPVLGDYSSVAFNKNCLSFGFNLQNVGPKMTYKTESDPLPTQLRLGFAVKIIDHPNHRLTLSCDASKLLVRRQYVTTNTETETTYQLVTDAIPKSLISAWSNPGGMAWGVGVEYWLFKWFGFRDGFYFEPSLLGNRKFYTTGTSFRIYYFQIDGSYIMPFEQNSPLSNSFKIGIRVGG